MSKLQLGYIALLIVAAVAGGTAYYMGGPLLTDGDGVMDVIVTLFSILAGFIIAIMTLLGDESLRAGGWRKARIDSDAVRRRLDRQQQLFWVYLLTLSLVLLARLTDAAFPAFSNELERISFGVAVFALVLSYALPVALRSAQISKLEKEVEKQKSQSSILDRN